MDREARDALDRIRQGIKSLARLGANAVHRRALAVVEAEIQRAERRDIRPLCQPENPEPGPHWPGLSGEPRFEFREAYYEHKQDDRRRSIFLDPIESLAAQFVDFYTDRIDVLEFRKTSDTDDKLIEAAKEKAIDYLRKNTSLIKVMTVAAVDTQEIIDSLRGLAHHLEQKQKQGQIASFARFPEIATLGREICHLIRTETSGKPKWSDNSRTLKQMMRDVYSCLDEDACCTNEAQTKFGAWEERVIWKDDGNPMHNPPIVPDPFVKYPWENRCPVFPSPVAAQVSSDWGWRQLVKDGVPYSDFHGGIDISVPIGTPVTAAVAGEVISIRDDTNDRGVIIKTGDEYRSYLHIHPDAGLRRGPVRAGTLLGSVAPYPLGPHLHFALHVGSIANVGNDAYSRDPCP